MLKAILAIFSQLAVGELRTGASYALASTHTEYEFDLNGDTDL